MPYVKLRFPPGVFRNGTKYESAGRWYDANLVRWSEGVMQAIGGWENIKDGNDADIDAGERICGLIGWKDNDGVPIVAYGTKDSVYVLTGGSETDITPTGGLTTAGADDASFSSEAYNDGAYNAGPYGSGAESGGILTEAQSWQFDTFGEKLVAIAYSDGIIYSWDTAPANNLTAVSNAPTDCRGLVVTPERFLVAIGAGDDDRQVKWSDQEDETTWTAASTNQAGGFILPGQGSLICGRRGRNETLIWGDQDLFAMRYIGGTLVYSFAQVGANCGIIGPLALAAVDGRFFWMGQRGFYTYDGGAKPVPCEISDEIFTSLNRLQRSKVAAVGISEFHEIWFMYPAGTSLTNNKIVCYNYLENHWSGPWDLERSVGIDRGAFGAPVFADEQGALYYHETGLSYIDVDGSTDLSTEIMAESGPFEIAQGDNVMTVRRVIPDEDTLGEVNMRIYAGLYPTASEAYQDITLAEPSDARITGRQVRLRVTQDEPGWRLGTTRLEVVPRGKR